MRKGRNGGKLKTGNTVNVGRPPKLPELDTLLAEVLTKETNGITAFHSILNALAKKAQSGDVRAAEVLLNRAYGQPRQQLAQVTEVRIVNEATDSSFTPPE